MKQLSIIKGFLINYKIKQKTNEITNTEMGFLVCDKNMS